MIAQHLGAVDVIVQVTGAPLKVVRIDGDEYIDCRVLINFESRTSQYYHVVIPTLPGKCECKVRNDEVSVMRLKEFLQDKVWLHVVGSSRIHHPISEDDTPEKIAADPEAYAQCEIHLDATSVAVINGGV